MNLSVARELAVQTRQVLRGLYDESRPTESVRDALASILEPEILDTWLDMLGSEVWRPCFENNRQDVVGMLDDGLRRKHGMFMTPDVFAEAMAGVIEKNALGHDSAVIDLSAGGGALLAAAILANPGLRAVGVERHPAMAIAAALALYKARGVVGGGGHDRIYVGDGLSESGAWTESGMRYAVVIGNPPYVGEKGNVALFRDLKDAHPHLGAFFGPRLDLLYLFFHRGLDLLAPGGRLIYLTSEYWLTASGAVRLRQDLLERARAELFVTFGTISIFRDAPGHHSLLSVFRRIPEDRTVGDSAWALQVGESGVEFIKGILDLFGRGDVQESDFQGDSWADVRSVRVAPEVLGTNGWTPFVDVETVRWGEDLRQRGSLLATLVRDQQGFVSGADRVTRAHRKRFGWDGPGMEVGDPIFMFGENEIPEELAAMKKQLFLPVLRGSALRANGVFYEPVGSEHVLYLDGRLSEEDEALVALHLEKFKVMLEVRREVEKGLMAWYRLHWPRRRKDFEGPKLVVARRGPGPCFSLDLSGSAISSDCTYLVAPGDVRDPVRYLATLMVILNGEGAGRYLAAFGKRKGKQLEFYAEPLRALPVGVRRDGDELRVIEGLWEGGSQSALEERVSALLGRTEVVAH